ncbi:MAG: hypothetical protein NZ611_07425, partial [Bacteroidia bacterium]|nr:hypothetical protein [Bacteroidia bacterium]
MWRLWLIGVGIVKAQPALFYETLHRRLIEVVRDTSRREWLTRLRQEMEALHRIEWNDRFFREIVSLYLDQSDSLAILLGVLYHSVRVDSLRLADCFLPVQDRSADAASLLTAYELLIQKVVGDTSQTGYLVHQLSQLAQSVIRSWLSVPEQPPPSFLVEAALKGYLRALIAAYAFFGFNESPESWQEKMRVIEAVGLLEYYAYGESANAF